MKTLTLTCCLFLFSGIAFTQKKYKIVEKPDESYASCFVYELRDENNKVVMLPMKVEKGFDCPFMLDIYDDRYIVYADDQNINQYDLKTGKIVSLLRYNDKIDGFSAAPSLSLDKSKMVIGFIDSDGQMGYDGMVRIIVIYFDEDRNVAQKKKYDRNVNFMCASICVISSYDLDFEDNNTIKYRVHENIDDPNAGKYQTIKIP